MSDPELPEMLRAALQRDPEAMAIDFDGRKYPWRFAMNVVRGLEEAIEELEILPGERVGFIAHTRPAHVAALWGLLITRRRASMIYGYQSADKLADDIRALRCPLVIADRTDWSEITMAAAKEVGSAALSLSDDGLDWVDGCCQVGPCAVREPMPDIAVETLSSGTTGRPKRIALTMKNLESSTRAAMASLTQMLGGGSSRAPLIVMLPMGNISGVYATTPAGAMGHPIALMEKFDIDRWLDFVRRYRPATADVPPAALAMLLMRGVTRDDLAGIRVIRTGAAPLDTEVHRVFAERFGIPINLSYGASEFCGVVTTWTMDDLERHGVTKRGSCGRALPGVALRVVDRESGEVLEPGAVGLLEARADRVGPEWIRTSDLVRLDADGFMWFEGRADDTIFRGGFKIAPEQVAEVLRSHPALADAAVIGLPDARLGQVPVAAVQARSGLAAPSAQELDTHARKHLAAYQVPVRFVVLDELPRTPSLKLSTVRLRELLDATAAS